jgi:hypothetical protein
MILKEVLSTVTDPDLPVIWVDPALADDFWSRLAASLADRRFVLLDLDARGPAHTHDELLECFRRSAGWPEGYCPNLNALKDCLLALDDPPAGGWVVLFREPGPLRQGDEATFEDLLEILELVHDIKLKTKGLLFKLVLAG